LSNNQKFKEEYIRLRPKYLQFAEKTATIIQEVLDTKGIHYHAITFRAKNIESASTKAKNPKYQEPINEITLILPICWTNCLAS